MSEVMGTATYKGKTGRFLLHENSTFSRAAKNGVPTCFEYQLLRSKAAQSKATARSIDFCPGRRRGFVAEMWKAHLENVNFLREHPGAHPLPLVHVLGQPLHKPTSVKRLKARLRRGRALGMPDPDRHAMNTHDFRRGGATHMLTWGPNLE